MKRSLWKTERFAFARRAWTFAVLLAALGVGADLAKAASRAASVSGDWNNTATWGGASVPVAGDTVTNNAGVTVTIPAGYTAECSTINFTTGNGASTILLADGTSALNVSGAVTIQRNGTAANKIDVGAGTFSAASVALQGLTGGTRLSQLLISTGTATISGTITSAGVDSQIIFSGAGTLNAGGTLLNGTAGTFTPSTGTVNYNGVAQTVGAYTYNHLTLSGSGAKTLTGVATVNGNLTLSGTATAASGANLAIGGNLVVGTGTMFTVGAHTIAVAGTTTVSGSLLHNSATGLKTYTGDVTINSGGGWTGSVLTIAYSFGGSFQNNGNLTANTNGVHTFTGSGKTFSGSNPIAISRLTIDGTYQNDGVLIVSNALAGTGTLTQGVNAQLIVLGPTNVSISLTTLNASANVNSVHYNGAVQTVKPVVYSHLTLSGSGAKNLTDVMTIGGDLTVSGSATLLSNAVMTVVGTFNYASSGTSTLTNNVTGGALTLANGTLNLGTNLTHAFAGNWTRTAGTLLANSSTLKIGGDISGSGGAFTAGTSMVEWNGAGAQTLAALTYHNLTLSGGGAKLIGVGSVVTGNMQIVTGSKADIEAGQDITVGSLSLDGVGQDRGTWGASASSATHTNDAFFSPTTGYLTVITDTRANTVTWRGVGDWVANPGNWSNGIPGPGSNVWIAAGTVTLASASDALGEFTVANGATLLFTNWATCLTASNVTIASGGLMTLPAAFTNNQMSNRVWVVCTNFTIHAGGQILTDAKGFATGQGVGSGIAMAVNQCAGGGGYGGKGGTGFSTAGGQPYGSTNTPLDPGSGGGTRVGSTDGGHGGGAVLIEAANSVTIDGLVSANGGNGTGSASTYGGGGSGGSIYMTCSTFGGGTNGMLQANGGHCGNAASTGTTKGGGGGGGRIVVQYTSLAGTPGVRFSANCGKSLYLVDNNAPADRSSAQVGTLRFSNTDLLEGVLNAWSGMISELNGYLYFESTNSWAPTHLLVVSNSTLGIPEGSSWRITNDLTVVTGGVMIAAQGSLQCKGNLTLTNVATLVVYGGETNSGPPNYGAWVGVTNTLTVATNCWIYPFSHSTNGGSVLFQVGGLAVQGGGGINANGRGLARGTGRGKGVDGVVNRGTGGGGYGGRGGTGLHFAGGNPYGTTNVLLDPGSGGGTTANLGGHGGGVVRIESAGSVTIDGAVTANGSNGLSSGSTYCGGGSGGSIFMTCASFGGAGTLEAKGGDASTSGGGGGGGGRISIVIGFSASQQADLVAGVSIPGLFSYLDEPAFPTPVSVANGNGYVSANPAQPGSRQYLKIVSASQRTVKITGDTGLYGAPGPLGYGDSWLVDDSTALTNAVATPANSSNGVRWACTGWRVNDTVQGTLITNDVSTQAVFTVTTNLTLTWLWTNQYWLAFSPSPNGSVNSNSLNGWYTNGTQVLGIEAIPYPGYVFVMWTGSDVPDGLAGNNPLTMTMDRSRTNITAVFASTTGQTMTWNGVGLWTSPTNWSPQGVPGSNDQVILQSGTSILSTAYATTGSVLVSTGATLVFSNWTTCLTASDVTILSNGVITLPAAFANNQMSNRVWVVCTNFTLNFGGQILADARGYAQSSGPGPGISGGVNDGTGGGGYGGKGGSGSSTVGGNGYGETSLPLAPGSGGGVATATGIGGSGGGAVRIEAAGIMTIDGTINANGGNGIYGSGGGSGGAILLTCASFGGSTQGILRANGGNSALNTYNNNFGGGGGGGRIAVLYASLVGTPGVRFSANCGAGLYAVDANAPADLRAAQLGTLCFTNPALVDTVLTAWSGIGSELNGYLFFQSTTGGTLSNLWMLSQSTLGIPEGTSLQLPNDLTVVTGGVVIAARGSLRCGGNLTLTNGASLVVYGGETNVIFPDYGALVGVTNTLTVAADCRIYPFAHSTNGGSVLLRVGDLKIRSGGAIDATGRGYANANGPGRGTNYFSYQGGAGGGGYGGKGGKGRNVAEGRAYGSTNVPQDPGSGGGNAYADQGYHNAGHGGGAVRIEANGAVTVDGAVRANGGSSGSMGEGGGSGGTIYLTCAAFDGSTNGVLQADGGSGRANPNFTGLSGGGGGGGRIAVWINVPQTLKDRYLAGLDVSVFRDGTNRFFLGTLSVSNGPGYINPPDIGAAEPGTAWFFIARPNQGTIFLIQ
jgi:hypothetical protein